MKHLEIFEGVPIPVDYASTQTYAIVARRDGGKTYTVLKFLEQMCDAGLFFVSLDPVGKHWALRAGPDGSPNGGKTDVYVLGGLHGDVPLDPESGALIADVVIDHPGRYVIDVSTFETDAEQDRFATAFAKRLFRRKAKDPGFPLLLVLEEAEDFIPQNWTSGQTHMLNAFKRIMKLGRNYGLGMMLVAQRTQDLNNKVLSQAEVLIVKQLAAKRDKDQIKDWAEANEGTEGQLKEMMGSLASLEQNEAWVWSPSWLRVFKRTTVGRRETFDSSASVKSGETMQDVELSPLDVDALGQAMNEIAKKAKDEDPKHLRKQVADLEQKLAESEGALEDLEAAEEAVRELTGQVEELSQRPADRVIREVSVLEINDATIREFWEVGDTLAGVVADIQQTRELIHRAVEEGAQVIDRAPEERREAAVPMLPAPAEVRQPRSPAPVREPSNNGDGQVGKAATEILEVLAGFPDGLTRTQISLLTGRKARGGSWNTAMSQIAPYVHDYGEKLAVNHDGMRLVGTPKKLEPAQIIARWRASMPSPAQEMLDIITTNPDRQFDWTELAELTNRAPRGGSWNTATKAIRESGIVELTGNGVKMHRDFALASSR